MSLMSGQTLVGIPFDDEKSSEHKHEVYDEYDIIDVDNDNVSDNSSVSETWNKKQQNGITALQYILSPSIKSIANDLIRIVSEKECQVLKKNIINVLKENNFDILYEFKLPEFTLIFKKILIASQNDEIIKLFNLFSQNGTLSFDCIINNDTHFTQLLESMGCVMEKENTNGEHVHETENNNNNIFWLNKTRESKSTKSNQMTPKYSPRRREYNANKPILSWKYSNNSYNHNQTNNNIYSMEYIEYQREIIEQQRNEINDIYKPCILYNKEMEIKIEALLKENTNLKMENNLLQKEVKLERENYENNKSDENENENDFSELSELNAIYRRRISTSYIEICESHQFLENELIDLQNNFKLTKSKSEMTSDENNKLKNDVNKYILLNEKLQNNINKMNKKINENMILINNKSQQINQFKYEMFEKDQTIESLNNLYSDTLLQLQFYTNSNYNFSKRKRNKLRNTKSNSIEFKVTSVRSNLSSFDIFNDLLSPAAHNNNNIINNKATTPNNYNNWNFYEQIIESNEYKIDKEIKDDHESVELIATLKNELEVLQKKHDDDMIQMKGEIQKEKEIRNQMKQQNINTIANISRKKTKTKCIATQTKKLGFWEKLFSQMHCVPIDENEEY